jgi:4-amino-4-deoxychorismate lyase
VASVADRVLAVLGVGLRDPAAPLLRADDLGVLRGEGVFETALVRRRRAIALDAHLDRLAASAARLELALPPRAQWEDTVATALGAWDDRDGVLRLVCSKGPDVGGAPVGYALLTTVPADLEAQRRDGVDAVTLTLGVAAGLRSGAPWLLGGVKSTSYAVNMAALRAARAAGAEDVVLVSADGQVLEGPTSTVVLAVRGALVTPPVEVGILPGTTAAALFHAAIAAGVPTETRPVSVEELRAADAAWLASSVRLLVRLRSLDGERYADVPTPLDRLDVERALTA